MTVRNVLPASQREIGLDALMRAARETAELDDFGDLSFLDPLAQLLDASLREIRFSAAGLAGFRTDLERALVNRLRMQADIKAHPKILDEDVSNPIVVVGLVRTGTSKLQRLLALDESVQSIPLWQILFPSRFYSASNDGEDPRPAFAAQGMGFASGPAAIAMQAAHPMQLMAPDEDIILFENTFDHLYLYLRNAAPSYLKWQASRSLLGPYRYYRTMLQYLQWQSGGKRGRPWVLKCTTHMSELNLLFSLFPNATVVQCHRDPREVIPSYARLQELAWSLRGEPGPSDDTGRSVLDIWSEQIKRHLACRRALAPADNVLIDVSYSDIKNRPLAVIERIYAATNRRMPPTMPSRIEGWERENPQHKFGRHEYSVDTFGLSFAAIDNAFSLYRQEFGQLF